MMHDGNAAATATERGEKTTTAVNASLMDTDFLPINVCETVIMEDKDGPERKEEEVQERENETAAAETIDPEVIDVTESPESVTKNQSSVMAVAGNRDLVRKRPVLPTEEEILARLQIFQHQQHSLRVSASNIAAMVGFHPWKILPELLMNLVYQGRDGQRLLRRDSQLLGLTLVSEETILLQLAAKAGDSTCLALQSALQVKKGSKKVESVETATKVKEKVLEEAKKTGKLLPKELKVLQEGARSAVDTGYGTAHEDGALDLYEKQCGWPVEQRNAEIREWPFVRLEDAKPRLGQENDLSVEQPTVVPLEIASSGFWKPSVGLDTEAQEEPSTSAPKRQKVVDLTDSSDVCLAPVDATASSTSSRSCIPIATETKRLTNPNPKPFFSIIGMVDGIRDELAPSTDKGSSETPSDDDSWVFRKVIVECKHRMNRIHVVPPLYEQIQTTAYCLMHQINEADIVQVMRKEVRLVKSKAPVVPSEKVNPSEKKPPPPTRQEPSRKSITISVSRISLDDPIMQHRTNWTQVVLPRLRSFVEAVFAIRSNDDKRYQLLIALSGTTDDDQLKKAWQILHDDCPWLESCDTAFHRD
jgi:hypothetical protein